MKKIIYASVLYLFVWLAFTQYAELQAKPNWREDWHSPVELEGVAFTNAAGERITLESFAGKPILLNVWASWCSPCIAELPAMLELSQKHADKFHFITMSVDRKGFETITPFLTTYDLQDLPTYADANSTIYAALGTKVLPTTFVLDSNGNIIGRIEGVAAWEDAKFIEKLLLKMKSGGE